MMGYDTLVWRVVEENDAVCSVPFVVDKGEVKAPKLRLKGVGGSSFGTKTYDVNPDNFAKMRCYGKGMHKDPKLHGKHIDCVGIDMFGRAIGTELLPDPHRENWKKSSSVTNAVWENRSQRSIELAERCMNVITGKKDILSIEYDEE